MCLAMPSVPPWRAVGGNLGFEVIRCRKHEHFWTGNAIFRLGWRPVEISPRCECDERQILTMSAKLDYGLQKTEFVPTMVQGQRQDAPHSLQKALPVTCLLRGSNPNLPNGTGTESLSPMYPRRNCFDCLISIVRGSMRHQVRAGSANQDPVRARALI